MYFLIKKLNNELDFSYIRMRSDYYFLMYFYNDDKVDDYNIIMNFLRNAIIL